MRYRNEFAMSKMLQICIMCVMTLRGNSTSHFLQIIMHGLEKYVLLEVPHCNSMGALL